jgi:hypothetical protein
MPLAMTPPERWLIERVTVVDDKELREPVLHFGHPWEGSKGGGRGAPAAAGDWRQA